MSRSIRCLEIPTIANPAVRTPFRQQLHATRALDLLADSYRSYTGDLANTLKFLRAGAISAPQLEGLKTSATRLQSQLSELISLISAQQSATANNSNE